MDSITKKAPVLAKISKFIATASDFDEATLHQSKRVVADTYGVAFSGVQTSAFEMALQSCLQLFGDDKYKIWGTKKTSTILGAVFYNALSVSSTDFDEGHRKAVGHPGSLVVPVALVLGKYLNKAAEEILKAVVVGYETGTRFSHARIKENITTYSSGRWGAIASAATAAYLLDLSIEETMYALSLASVLSPAMLGGSTDVSTGSMAKEGVAWAAQSGLQSALLAQNGFVGPYLFVDEHDDFDRNNLLSGIGKTWLINSNYFKPYACCRWLHAGIKAAIDLKVEKGFNPLDIEQIEINIFSRALDLISSKYPENAIQAQFHLPYTVACALLFDQIIPKYFSDIYLKNENIHSLIGKIKLVADKQYTKQFPEKIPTRVKISMKDNSSFSKEVLVAPWEASSPPSDEALKQKLILQSGEKGIAFWDFLIE